MLHDSYAFKIKIEQTCVRILILFRKRHKSMLEIERKSISVGVNRNEAASSPIAVCESMLDKIQNCPVNAFVIVIFRNGETTNFHRRIGLATFADRNSAVNPIPDT